MKKKLSIFGLCFLMLAGFSFDATANLQSQVPSEVNQSTTLDKEVDKDKWIRRRYSVMTCRVGLRAYRGFITRVWVGRAYGIRSYLTHRRACQAALYSCHRYNRLSYNRGMCVVLGKSLEENLGNVPVENVEMQ